ncbi:MAG: hypothetical protein E6R03_08795 [Hyphomicrobiaceae bacterium]|nr:MAG: hypothetical protein E6R03_08795 [Hyphomicrobiaceae bacterium]
MSNSKTASSGGIGVSGLLGVVFVVLKLLGKITWSWWWVTLPFWGGIALLLAVAALTLLATLVVAWLDTRGKRPR